MLIIESRLDFGQLLAFLILDLLVALQFQLMDLSLFLLILGFFLFTTVGIINLCITEEVIAVPFFLSSCDLSIFVVIEDVDELLVEIELSLSHLLSGWLLCVQFKLLSHLLDTNALWMLVVVLLQDQVFVLNSSVVWIETTASIS